MKIIISLTKLVGLLSVLVLVSCNQGSKIAGSLASSSTNGSSALPVNQASCSFNGQEILSGQSVTGYLSSSVAFGQTCSSQSLSCSNGTLSGSYTFATCTVAQALSCTFNGQTVISGGKVQGYTTSSVPAGQTCTPETVSCTNGVLNPNNAFATCTVLASPSPTPTPAPCSFDGKSVANGSSVTAYQASVVPFGQTCTSQSRSCSNGTLSGSYTFASCSVTAAASCTFNGQTVISGGKVQGYTTSSVPAGQTCTLETVTCTNGVLNPNNAFATCTVLASPSPTPAPTPVATATVNWAAPTTNTNGSALTNLAGFNIYYGTSQNALTREILVSNPSATSYQVTNLTSGTWYFAVTAVSTGGSESAQSSVGSKVIP